MANFLGITCREMSVVKHRIAHLPTGLVTLVRETAGANNRPTKGRRALNILCTPLSSSLGDSKPSPSRRLTPV